MAYHQFKYKHQLIIRESRAFEVLSAMITLSYHVKGEAKLELDGIKQLEPLAAQFPDEISWMHQHGEYLFAWMEFALIVDERDDIQQYFNCILDQPQALQWFYFLSSRIDLESLKKSTHSQADFKACLQSHEISNAEALAQQIFDFNTFTKRFCKFATAIDQSVSFQQKWTELLNSDLLTSTKQTFHANMADRHPLSYAQELMNKPFWNIADYQTYEFIVLYFLSPIQLRLFSSDTMIYVYSLSRISRFENTLHETLGHDYKLLSDPNRLKILKMLYMHPMYGKQISDATGLTTATVSHHLEVLRQNGFLNMEQEKQIKYFSTNLGKIKSLNQSTLSYIQSNDPNFL